MFWTSLRLPFCMTKHRAWKLFEHRTFWRTTTLTSMVMKSSPVILRIWMPVIMLDPSWRTRLKKRMLSEPLATWYSCTKMEERITAVLWGIEFNAELFEPLLPSYPARLQSICDANIGNTEYWACEHRPTIKCATYRCFHFFPIMLSLLWWGGRGGEAFNVWHPVYISIHIKQSVCRRLSIPLHLSAPPPGYILGLIEINFWRQLQLWKRKSFCSWNLLDFCHRKA